MNDDNFIPVKELCSHYQVEISFFNELKDIGLIEVKTIRKKMHINLDSILEIEKIVRLHHELSVNMEGIDVIFNLLQKLHQKEIELNTLKNRLRIYEN